MYFHKVMQNGNVAPLLQQIAEHPELWNTNKVRTSRPYTAHHDVADIIMRFPRPNTTQYNFPAFNILREAQPIIFALMQALRGEYLGRVLISRLPPGATISPHDDKLADGSPMFFSRYQVPLQGKPGVEFRCGGHMIPGGAGVEFHKGGEVLYMEPGSIIGFKNTIIHSVANYSDEDRISMVVDIRPFTPAIL